MNFKQLVWSEESKPNHECCYDHCSAVTPLGNFLITWKSWKDYPGYSVDETPWGEGIYTGTNSLEEAKAAAEKEWHERLTQCVEESSDHIEKSSS